MSEREREVGRESESGREREGGGGGGCHNDPTIQLRVHSTLPALGYRGYKQ